MTKRPNLPKTASVADADDQGRLHAPSAARNAAAICDVLKRFAPATGDALELASGSGQHVVEFAKTMDGLTWQPSEIDADRRISIDLWSKDVGNILPVIALDAAQPGWSDRHSGYDFIVLVNLFHLISEAHVHTIIHEATHALRPEGRFAIYGPFLRNGVATSDGDARFDASLRAADPAIGYKDLDTVRQWLADAGLVVLESVDMPANNVTLIAEKPEDME